MNKAAQNSMWFNFFAPKDDNITQITKLWQQTPLFTNLPQKVCRHLVERMHPRTYEKHQMIFKTNDLGAGVILIKSGKISIKNGDQELAQLSTGDFFGETALVSDQGRLANAVAVEKSELVFFLQSDFEEWKETAPKYGAQLLLNLSRVLVTRLTEANLQIENEA